VCSGMTMENRPAIVGFGIPPNLDAEVLAKAAG
jgi:hypothetical protein